MNFCLDDCHPTRSQRNTISCPLVDLMDWMPQAQSLSEHLGGSSVFLSWLFSISRASPITIFVAVVPTKYLSTRLADHKWACTGLSMKRLRTFTANDMSGLVWVLRYSRLTRSSMRGSYRPPNCHSSLYTASSNNFVMWSIITSGVRYDSSIREHTSKCSQKATWCRLITLPSRRNITPR